MFLHFRFRRKWTCRALVKTYKVWTFCEYSYRPKAAESPKGCSLTKNVSTTDVYLEILRICFRTAWLPWSLFPKILGWFSDWIVISKSQLNCWVNLQTRITRCESVLNCWVNLQTRIRRCESVIQILSRSFKKLNVPIMAWRTWQFNYLNRWK